MIVLVRVVDGTLKNERQNSHDGDRRVPRVDRVGVFTPKMTEVDELGPGEIGFLTGSIKEVADTRVGDTLTDDRKPLPATTALGSRPATSIWS